jgi:hypothetical protein
MGGGGIDPLGVEECTLRRPASRPSSETIRQLTERVRVGGRDHRLNSAGRAALGSDRKWTGLLNALAPLPCKQNAVRTVPCRACAKVVSGPARTGLTAHGNEVLKPPLDAHCTCAGGTLEAGSWNLANGARKPSTFPGRKVRQPFRNSYAKGADRRSSAPVVSAPGSLAGRGAVAECVSGTGQAEALEAFHALKDTPEFFRRFLERFMTNADLGAKGGP